MRNFNPGNIKYVGQPGTHPSINTDQGDPQAVYPTPEAGMAAMYRLLAKKYRGGKVTPNMIIAGQGGWTPGNRQAAANVARTMGIGPDDDIGFNDPARAARFMRGLLLQEHGEASNAYSDEMIHAAIGGGGSGVTREPTPNATVEQAAYDPRRDTPSTGQPVGSKLPVQPSQYSLQVRHPDNPMVGTGGTQIAATEPLPPYPGFWNKERQKTAGEVLGEGIAKMGAQPEPATSLPGIAKPQVTMSSLPSMPFVDPGQADMKRQQLAMLMQRLNQNALW
jgi:hypothetical protein